MNLISPWGQDRPNLRGKRPNLIEKIYLANCVNSGEIPIKEVTTRYRVPIKNLYRSCQKVSIGENLKCLNGRPRVVSINTLFGVRHMFGNNMGMPRNELNCIFGSNSPHKPLKLDL